jgi:sugar phosphate isomerase/epimerase
MSQIEIGLCSGCFMELTLPELIELAGRHGFPTMTARPWTYAQALENGWSEARLRRLISDAGVRVTQIDCLSKGMPGAPQPGQMEKYRAIFPPDAIDPPDEETVFRAAEGLGAPWVNVALFGGSRVPLEQMVEGVAAVSRRAAKRGLGIALEFTPDSGLPDIGYAQQVVAGTGETNCRITLDFWHLDRSGGGVEDIQALPSQALGGVQIDDRIRPPPGQPYVPLTGRSLPGEGELPLNDLMRAALKNTPGITAEMEVFNAELKGLGPDAAAARMAQAARTWQAAFEGG